MSTISSDLQQMRDRLDPDVIRACMRRGERMRSAAIRSAIRGLFGRRPATYTESSVDAAFGALSALTAIKASAEVLRDCPDIGPAERTRFAGIVLREEARLERLVREMFEREVGKPTAA